MHDNVNRLSTELFVMAERDRRGFFVRVHANFYPGVVKASCSSTQAAQALWVPRLVPIRGTLVEAAGLRCYPAASDCRGRKRSLGRSDFASPVARTARTLRVLRSFEKSLDCQRVRGGAGARQALS